MFPAVGDPGGDADLCCCTGSMEVNGQRMGETGHGHFP